MFMKQKSCIGKMAILTGAAYRFSGHISGDIFAWVILKLTCNCRAAQMAKRILRRRLDYSHFTNCKA